MEIVSVGEVENGFFECLNLGIHLVRLDVRLELREVVNCTLAVGGSDNVSGILANIFGDLAPGGFDSSDRIG